MTVWWVDVGGLLLEATPDDDAGPAGATKVTRAPPDGFQRWTGGAWVDTPEAQKERDRPSTDEILDALLDSAVVGDPMLLALINRRRA